MEAEKPQEELPPEQGDDGQDAELADRERRIAEAERVIREAGAPAFPSLDDTRSS